MHTIGFLDLEDEEKASTYFERSYSLYTREPFKVWSEAIPGTPSAGNFITGAGGFLQSVLNGYGGVRLHFDHLKITKSYLPKDSTGLEFKGISYLNNVFRLTIDQNQKNFSVVSFDPSHVIRVTVDGAGYGDLKAGFSVTIPRDREIILRPMSDRCAMKETIVGVKTQDKPVEIIDDEWTLGSN
jgi:protein-glucosylgalactosylhydroxylysine glucosidase